MLPRPSFGEPLFGEADWRAIWTLLALGELFFILGLRLCDSLITECSLILRSAEGEGKLVSLLRLTEDSLPTDRAELNPLELEVRLPRPFSLGEYWYLTGVGGGMLPPGFGSCDWLLELVLEPPPNLSLSSIEVFCWAGCW